MPTTTTTHLNALRVYFLAVFLTALLAGGGYEQAGVKIVAYGVAAFTVAMFVTTFFAEKLLEGADHREDS